MELTYQNVTEDFAVAPQIVPAQLAEIARAGFRSVINNRPDLEGGAGQPNSAEIEAAARAAGLEYAWLPVIPGQFTADEIAAMAALVARLPGPVLAFCRSGARAANLYLAASGSRT
ncbi:MAG: TIGR01244 family sulfur transferase [Gammaproteobacteria bacterium]|nr:TIGR01244 family sulfur transferase [Gammaproteobacteria bacterium]